MKCNNCGRILPDDSEFCQYCGQNLQYKEVNEDSSELVAMNLVASDELTSEQPKPVPNEAQMNTNTPARKNTCATAKKRYCSHCGEPIHPKTKACTGCGKKAFPLKAILISFGAICVIAGVVFSTVFYFLPESKYKQAVTLMKNNKYESANAIFNQIIDYKDSKDLIHNHSYTKIIERVDPTCEVDGSIIKECICGKTEKETIKGGHTYSIATCTEPAKCTKCGKIGSSALGHDTKNAFCSRCGVKMFETKTYSGRGSYSITGITLPAGKYNVKFTHSGSSNFIVNGSTTDIYVNEIGKVNYTCQITSSEFRPMKNGYINITNADGTWTVTIEAIS